MKTKTAKIVKTTTTTETIKYDSEGRVIEKLTIVEEKN